MRKLVLLSVCVALLLLIFSVSMAQDEVIELVIWGEPGTVTCINEEDESVGCIYARYLNDTWHEMHPNIRLVWEDHSWDEALRQNLVTAQLGGVEPDITVGESFMPSLVANGSFAALELSDEVRENLVPGTVLAVTSGDALYGVGAFTAVFALEVNADVVRAAGLDPDMLDLSTWEAVSEAAAAVNEAGGGDFYGFSILGPTPAPAAALFRAAPYVYQTGANFCDEGCVNPTFNDPLALPVYEWFRELYQYTPPGLAFNGDEGFVFTQLFEGMTAMQTAGAWHPNWAKSSGCEDCRYLPLPVPAEGMGANVVVGNAMYSALATTEHLEEATMFLEWLADDTVQLNGFWGSGRMPTTFSALETLLAVADGDLSSVPDYVESEDPQADAAVFVGYADELINGDVRILPPWASKGPELNQLWNDMFAEVLTSDRDIAEILDDYQAQAEAIVAE